MKTKLIIALVLISLADIIIPVPILGIILIYVVLARPRWFSDIFREIYGDHF